MRVLYAALAAAALLDLVPAAAAEPPRRVALGYEVSHNGTVVVEATETLEHDGRRYRIRSEWKGKGLYARARRGSALRSSEGAVEGGHLRPAEFRDQRGEAPLGIARFDWAHRQLVLEREGRIETRPLPERAQDRLSFAWGFAFAPPAQEEIEVFVADAKGLSRQRYRVAGAELLRTAAGDFDAVKLVKQREAGDPRTTEIWLAAKADYLPLRILVVEKDGTRIDQVVTWIGR
ncbi:MAG: DUF3108 domain-containing protein [Betaproteobacteria bacterium]|nr:DUF3108 domain-containing protein [Betaproteobacteria bacterium]